MEIFTDKKYLYLKFSLAEKILGVHWSFKIPLSDIIDVHTQRPKICHFKEIRAPGTHFPGLIKAGTYFTKRGREFWYITRKNTFLTIELNQGFYKRIILSINNSESMAEKIKKVIIKTF